MENLSTAEIVERGRTENAETAVDSLANSAMISALSAVKDGKSKRILPGPVPRKKSCAGAESRRELRPLR